MQLAHCGRKLEAHQTCNDPDGKYVYVGINMNYLNNIDKITCGMDDSQDTNIKKAVANQSMLKKLLVLQEDYNEADEVNNSDYVAGYIFLRYLAKQAFTRGEELYNSTANQSLAGSAYEDTPASSADKVTIPCNASNYGGSNVKLFGSDGADQIFSYGNKVTLDGGWHVTINGGAGNDEIHSAAKGAAIDAGDGNDTLRLSGINFSSKTSGKNILLTVDGQNIKLVEGEGVACKVSVAGTSGNDTVNNSIAGASINLLDGDNRVFNEGKKSSIVTGAGNDKLNGGKGNFKSSKYSGSKLK